MDLSFIYLFTFGLETSQTKTTTTTTKKHKKLGSALFFFPDPRYDGMGDAMVHRAGMTAIPDKQHIDGADLQLREEDFQMEAICAAPDATQIEKLDQ